MLENCQHPIKNAVATPSFHITPFPTKIRSQIRTKCHPSSIFILHSSTPLQMQASHSSCSPFPHKHQFSISIHSSYKEKGKDG